MFPHPPPAPQLLSGRSLSLHHRGSGTERSGERRQRTGTRVSHTPSLPGDSPGAALNLSPRSRAEPVRAGSAGLTAPPARSDAAAAAQRLQRHTHTQTLDKQHKKAQNKRIKDKQDTVQNTLSHSDSKNELKASSPGLCFLETCCITTSKNPVLRISPAQFSEFEPGTVPLCWGRGESGPPSLWWKLTIATTTRRP